MKKLMLFCLSFCAVVSAMAQDLPYSKYLNFSKSEFKENHFKYHEKTNTWYLNKTNGLSETFNILLIITGSFEDTRPDINDYSIVVQLGEEDKASCVRVIYYNDETYIRLLTYLKNNCQNLMDVSTGKLTRHLATYGDYELELTMEKHTISRYMMRMVITAAVIVAAYYTSYLNVPALVIGLFGSKAGAYLQPSMHRFLEWIHEKASIKKEGGE